MDGVNQNYTQIYKKGEVTSSLPLHIRGSWEPYLLASNFYFYIINIVSHP